MWRKFLTEQDTAVFEGAGYGNRASLGKRPAVLVIDVTTAFIGDEPEPILKSIKRFPNSCGQEGWDGVQNIQKLLRIARDAEVPIIYTASSRLTSGRDVPDLWAQKHPKGENAGNRDYNKKEHIASQIAPLPDDIVIEKQKPSAFFGTPLETVLRGLAVDTLIVSGCTTSGCVRATVVDAFSYNFPVLIVSECVFDRGQASHAINLFDMQQKYANIGSLEETSRYMLAIRKVEHDIEVSKRPS